MRNTGTGNEDIWRAFDNANHAWSAVNDLGQYGKFVVDGIVYDNLNNAARSAPTPAFAGDGRDLQRTLRLYTPRVAINYLPSRDQHLHAHPGADGTFDISFGSAHAWARVARSAHRRSPAIAPAPLNFVIAAFQPGVIPTNPMNGGGKIAPLRCCAHTRARDLSPEGSPSS